MIEQLFSSKFSGVKLYKASIKQQCSISGKNVSRMDLIKNELITFFSPSKLIIFNPGFSSKVTCAFQLCRDNDGVDRI